MSDKPKKRKSNLEDSDRPSKRHTASSAGLPTAFSRVKVKHVDSDDGGLGPVVASTPGISAPSAINFTPYKRTFVMKSGDKTKRRQVLLQSSSHPRLDYLAQEESAGGPQGNLRHYVGIFDPQAGEIVITECRKVTMRSSLRPTQEELDEEERGQERQSNMALRQTLGMEFGTKKAKKIIADNTTNAILRRKPGETAPPVDAAQKFISDAVAAKIEHAKTAEEKQAVADASKPRPRSNPDASRPSEVYPIETLLETEVADALRMSVNDWIKKAKRGESMQLKMRYVANRLQKVATGKDAADNVRLLKFVDVLLNWYNSLMSAKGGGRKLPKREVFTENVDAPGSVLDSIRVTFSQGLVLTKWHVEKLILHVCALALHLDNYEVDVYDLQEDLGLDTRAMTKYFQELGCRIQALTAMQRDMKRLSPKEAATHKVAKLQLPLEFPRQRIMRQQR